ncbi:M3 family metallopeptidase [Haliea sp. AH-315-K21]|nr:M3 family metallopeptidase [Haliea sp. AH-315-K21]MBN4075243.1 M3 family metallopeptidase [Gammaproteobacteria bacterium AH-315-E17]
MAIKHSLLILTISFLSACSSENSTTQPSSEIAAQETETTMSNMPTENPFLTPSPLPFQFPQFSLITPEHYLPAFEQGMAEQLAEITAITNQPEAPTFADTMIPLEVSGRLLDRVASVFYAMTSAHTNEDINAIEVEIAPLLSAHNDQIYLNETLFNRINMLYQTRDSLELDSESLRLLEEAHKAFIRAGAELNATDKQRLRTINTELAELSTRFGQNVLNEVNSLAIVVDNRIELAGLSDAEIQAAADAATARDFPGKYVIPLLNTSDQPSLAKLENRELRQRIYETSLSRGNSGGEYDNREILSRTVSLRSEKAQLLGFATHADYILQNQTAQTVDAVNQSLAGLIPPAVANARREAADLQAMIDAEEGGFELAAWDWAFYAEKVRQDIYQFDENQLRPYFEVNNVMQNGLFYAAEQIYGLSFEERKDLPVYQDDVRVFEVLEQDGNTLAFFIMDLYARSSKSGGAWMNAYVSQSSLLEQQAVVANHLNIPEPPAGEPTLMTFDEVTTMFHEFGHALHGMFSNVTYPSFSGTSVPRDFVEFPSQVNEMWASWPEVLENYAVHYATGEPLPAELLARVIASQKFNQGFATTEYLAAAFTDLALHQLSADEIPNADDIMQFEADALVNAGIDLPAVSPRYRLSYFSHIMGGYSAGYYSYIWSEVLDADTVEWFKENGGMLRENGQHFRDSLLSQGGSTEAMELFRNFRGREPNVEPLLIRRGLN